MLNLMPVGDRHETYVLFQLSPRITPPIHIHDTLGGIFFLICWYEAEMFLLACLLNNSLCYINYLVICLNMFINERLKLSLN